MADLPYRIQLKQDSPANLNAAAYEGLPGIETGYYNLGWYAGGAWRWAAPGDVNGNLKAAEVYVSNVLRITSGGEGRLASLKVANLASGKVPLAGVSGLLGDSSISEDADSVDVSKPLNVEGQQVKKRSFACIYLNGEGSTAQSIPSGATYTKITPFDTNMAGSLLSVADQANDQLVAGRDGLYIAGFTRSYTVGTANTVWHVAVFVNGVLQPQAVVSVKSTSTNTLVYADLDVPIQCNANDSVDIRVRHDQGAAVNLTYEHATLYISSID